MAEHTLITPAAPPRRVPLAGLGEGRRPATNLVGASLPNSGELRRPVQVTVPLAEFSEWRRPSVRISDDAHPSAGQVVAQPGEKPDARSWAQTVPVQHEGVSGSFTPLAASDVCQIGRASAPVIPNLFPSSGENLSPLAGEKRTLRTQLAALITDALDMLDRLDGDTDLEPDAEGEAEPEEASAQPLTLAMDRFPPVVHRPSIAQMRRAYRETGAAVPANLRFDIFGRARA
jgi:hypothetical protein